MFLFMFLGLIILRLKKCVFYRIHIFFFDVSILDYFNKLVLDIETKYEVLSCLK